MYEACDIIEKLIDKHGLLHVATALECVCGEKAEHIKVNWQDRNAAKPWTTAERKFTKLVREIELLKI